MIGLDTTVLIAHELTEAPLHQQVRNHIPLLCRERGTRFGLAPQVLQEFLHVATDPRRFQQPLTMEQALARANFWWDASEVVHCHINDKSWHVAISWIEKHSLGRKRILDTTLAAIYHDCGIQALATANPADFAVFGVFQFESWARAC
jgi:predicted nucleic acid-binding protein